MGYHSINKGEIERIHDGDIRFIVAKVYCDELEKWFTMAFTHAELDAALKWIEEKMSELSM